MNNSTTRIWIPALTTFGRDDGVMNNLFRIYI